MPDVVTTDPQKALEDTEIVMIGVPAYRHRAFMEATGPHLTDGQVVVFNTGYWASLRFKNLLEKLRKDVIPVETELLVYLCMAVEPGHIHIEATKGEVSFSAMPAKFNRQVEPLLREVYPQFKAVNNVLETNFMSLNAFIHGPIALLNAGHIDNLGCNPCSFYGEGNSPRVAKVHEAVDRERVAVCNALGIEAQTMLQRMSSMYGHMGAKGDTIYEATVGMHGKAEDKKNTMNPPADFIFALAHEDVPYSLIPPASIAEQLGIEVPTIRAMIQFHSLINDRDYQEEAVTAENLGFAGMTPEQIRRYVQEGIR